MKSCAVCMKILLQNIQVDLLLCCCFFFLENKLKKKNQCLIKALQRNGFKTSLYILWDFYFSHVVQHHTNWIINCSLLTKISGSLKSLYPLNLNVWNSKITVSENTSYSYCIFFHQVVDLFYLFSFPLQLCLLKMHLTRMIGSIGVSWQEK